ncbi:MAG: hypothetical protein LBQ22_03650 [Bacteroidales bacterium]|jgi:transcriptional antiterminator|nr:hypothetical protein [Bacteroidales bacterium]
MKKTIILVKYGMISEIAAALKISTRTVRRALKGNTTVQKYNLIRKYTLENGGVEVQMPDDYPDKNK